MNLLHLVKLGAIEHELQILEQGGIPPSLRPSRSPAPELSERDMLMRIAFLAELGNRALSNSVSN